MVYADCLRIRLPEGGDLLLIHKMSAHLCGL